MDEAGLRSSLGYLFLRCTLHPSTVLDYPALERSLVAWHGITAESQDKEAFLDLLSGFFNVLHNTYKGASEQYKRNFADLFDCENVGRTVALADTRMVDKHMKHLIDSSLRRERVAYLHTFGLTPRSFVRILRRYSDMFQRCSNTREELEDLS